MQDFSQYQLNSESIKKIAKDTNLYLRDTPREEFAEVVKFVRCHSDETCFIRHKALFVKGGYELNSSQCLISKLYTA